MTGLGQAAENKQGAPPSPASRGPFLRFLRLAFGIWSLVLLLSLVAAVPLLNLFALGVLLEAEARVARGARFRDAGRTIDFAGRVGEGVLGFWVCLIPLRILSDLLEDARIVRADSHATETLEIAAVVFAGLLSVHLTLACLCGGRFSHFVRPLRNIRLVRPRMRRALFQEAREAWRRVWTRLQVRHHLSLGARGFFGAFVWLLVPTAMFVVPRTSTPLGWCVVVVGAAATVFVLGWLPFLQVQFAVENRLGAMFALQRTRTLFARRPFLWVVVLGVFYALTTPLYVLKTFLAPPDVRWLMTAMFIVSILPARLVVAWAYGRAERKDTLAHPIVRKICKSGLVAVTGLYVFGMFFLPHIGAQGRLGLFEHHAFLLPFPFW